MSKESKTMEKEAKAKAVAKQPWTAQRVLDTILNNALIIIMIIAVIYIAIVNKNFLKAASIINILAQTCAYLPVALGVGGCIVLTGGVLGLCAFVLIAIPDWKRDEKKK